MKFERDYRDPSFVEKRHLMYTMDPSIFTKAMIVGPENINKLFHAGVLIGAGNDGGVPQVAPGDVGRELLLLIQTTDLEPMDALQAGTINNARILGMEKDLGSVEEGKLADLVLLPGNPLECIDHVLHPDAVFKEGKLLHTTNKIQI
jgi:imidazolonepropionase-like amidohydrolase